MTERYEDVIEQYEVALAAIRRGDYTNAQRLLRPMADRGYAIAQFQLGVMAAKGQGTTKSNAEAVRFYRLAADRDNSDAQQNLGVMYAAGRGVPQNYGEAAKWHRLAAEKGDALAQNSLGLIYANGRGVMQNDAEAIRWYRLAADQGNDNAQYNLGSMYRQGRGVPLDYAAAAKWFRLAADKGNTAAQDRLGLLYALGQGVPPSHAEAAKWFSLAANHEDPNEEAWMFPKLFDYWDARVGAIDHFSRVFEAIPPTERATHARHIGAAIARHVAALSDESLMLASYVIVEDLYKTASHLTYWDDALAQYLAATGTAFFRALNKRGYSVNYFIDNSYPTLSGPANWFRVFFQTASMEYICPQEIACRVIEKDRPEAEWPLLVSKYIEISRPIGDKAVDEFYRDGKSFVFLDTDATEFSIAQKTQGKPGVVHVFRQEAPEPGSRCVFTKPPGPRAGALSGPV
jgi:TPR repeat protein